MPTTGSQTGRRVYDVCEILLDVKALCGENWVASQMSLHEINLSWIVYVGGVSL